MLIELNNTVSSMIDMKLKDGVKRDTVSLDKTNLEETELPEVGLYRFLYRPGEQQETKKDKQQTLSGVKIDTD